ncbi:hypothetical protein B0T11DRAFT_302994 [Plectosphaerella cucumerina]|uniref:C2H2-type domain-containing protein n=1 Tax=Plectosphaerella cucumerina TaxID=40658 RepID=A0A8K0WY84_9PEZI|nr:hypothetical protein B0T11DRAFT_302994 [Plectosphaerella cucumerina]
MPREGNNSPSRRSPTPGKSSKGTSDKTSLSSTREKTASPSSRDGKQGRDRSVRPSPVAVAPIPSGLPSGVVRSHQSASRREASPVPSIARLRMNSPEASAFVQARIYQRRVELINKLMAVIAPCIDKTLSALEAACDGGGNLPGRSGTKRGSGSISSSSSSGGRSMGQKRGSGNQSHESDGENEGDQRSGGRTIKRAKTITERNQKFACPYYKRDPIKHAHTPREHLYRRHELSQFKCHRCCEHFDQEKELEDHQRMDVPCPVRERGAADPIHGFDEQQRNILKSFNKKSKLTEVERWKEVYSVLFRIPIDSPEMPSPFYEPSDAVHAETSKAIDSTEFKACMSYCRREAPKVIRQALESNLDRELSNIEERMKFKLAQLVEMSLDRLLRTYQSIKQPEDLSLMPDPNSSIVVRDIGEAPAPVSNHVLQTNMASLIHSFLPEDLDFGAVLELDNNFFPVDSFQPDQQANMCHQPFDADSGYRTCSDGSNSSDPTEALASPSYELQRSHRY